MFVISAGAKPSSEEATAISTSLADASESAECSQPASSYQSVPEVPSVSQQANTLAAAAAVTESTESSNSVPSEVTMDSGGDQQKGSSAKRASKSSTATRSVNRPRQLSVNGKMVCLLSYCHFSCLPSVFNSPEVGVFLSVCSSVCI